MHHFPIFHLPSFVFRTAYLHRRRLFSITVIWWSVDGGNRKQGALLYEYNLLDGENSSAAQREKGINACIGKQIKRKKKSQTQVHQLWLFHLFSVQSWARAHTTAITNRVAYRTEKEEMRERKGEREIVIGRRRCSRSNHTIRQNTSCSQNTLEVDSADTVFTH